VLEKPLIHPKILQKKRNTFGAEIEESILREIIILIKNNLIDICSHKNNSFSLLLIFYVPI
jgi:hypothetical protein